MKKNICIRQHLTKSLAAPRLLGLAGTAVAAGMLSFGAAMPKAEACGGMFCSTPAQPVNQAAERIVFIHDEDGGTNNKGETTAIVQIQFNAPPATVSPNGEADDGAREFSWILPVPGVPDVGVSSNIAFSRLLAMTNPQYSVTQTIEGECKEDPQRVFSNNTALPSAESAGSVADSDAKAGVSVEASGETGPYNYVVLSLTNTNAGLQENIEVLTDWLAQNEYYIPGYKVEMPDEDDMSKNTATRLTEGDPEYTTQDWGDLIVKTYMVDGGMNLMAIKLQGNAGNGDIRPIKLTYDSINPMIPIKPTAVATASQLPVLAWTLSKERMAPKSSYDEATKEFSGYASLTLNEMALDWLNITRLPLPPGYTAPENTRSTFGQANVGQPANYLAQIEAAAGTEAPDSHGFVTEMAGKTDFLEDQIAIPSEGLLWDGNQPVPVQASLKFDLTSYAASDVTNEAFVDGLALLDRVETAFTGWDGLDRSYTSILSESDCSEFATDQNGENAQAFLAEYRRFRQITQFNAPVTVGNVDEQFNQAGFEFDRDVVETGVACLDFPALATALQTEVVDPVEDFQALVSNDDTGAYVTRMFTSMAASAMDEDPAFIALPDGKDVSNVRIADMTISCDEDTLLNDAPYTLTRNNWEVKGTGPNGAFPVALPAGDDNALPATIAVEAFAANTAQLVTISDRTAAIEAALEKIVMENASASDADVTSAKITNVPTVDGDKNVSVDEDSQGSLTGGGCNLPLAPMSSFGLMLIGLAATIRRRR